MSSNPRERPLSSTRRLGASKTTAQPAEIPCDPHSLGVEILQLAQLDVAQARPPTKQWREKLVPDDPLLDEVIGLHRREVVRELLHPGGLPPRVAEPAEQEDDEKDDENPSPDWHGSTPLSTVLSDEQYPRSRHS